MVKVLHRIFANAPTLGEWLERALFAMIFCERWGWWWALRGDALFFVFDGLGGVGDGGGEA